MMRNVTEDSSVVIAAGHYTQGVHIIDEHIPNRKMKVPDKMIILPWVASDDLKKIIANKLRANPRPILFDSTFVRDMLDSTYRELNGKDKAIEDLLSEINHTRRKILELKRQVWKRMFHTQPNNILRCNEEVIDAAINELKMRQELGINRFRKSWYMSYRNSIIYGRVPYVKNRKYPNLKPKMDFYKA
jgi:hypothetical protein